jgi:phosphatidylglycerophosphate synthase
MLDGRMRPLIDRPLKRIAAACAGLPLSANAVTLIGLGFGLGCALAIVWGMDGLALLLLAANRFADGLDGAIARRDGPGDRARDLGGYLDIVLDFVFYGIVPLAFVLRLPEANAVAGATLLFAFYVNGASFLAFAVLAAKRRLETTAQGLKSIYFSAGLVEGTETILCFALMILFPAFFTPIAFVFAGLTLATALGRVLLAWRTFGD